MARQVSDSLALEGRARLRCKARRRHDWTQCRIITDKPAAASIAVNGGATPATPLGQGVGHYHLLASQAHSSPSYRPPQERIPSVSLPFTVLPLPSLLQSHSDTRPIDRPLPPQKCSIDISRVVPFITFTKLHSGLYTSRAPLPARDVRSEIHNPNRLLESSIRLLQQ